METPKKITDPKQQAYAAGCRCGKHYTAMAKVMQNCIDCIGCKVRQTRLTDQQLAWFHRQYYKSYLTKKQIAHVQVQKQSSNRKRH